MAKLSSWAIDAWRRSPFCRCPRFPGVLRVASRADIPDALPRRAVTLVGEPAKWAIIPCPCGRGHIIDLNLAHPGNQWRVQGDQRLTITPSVDVQDLPGRCHFLVKDGRVRWVHRTRRRTGRTRRDR